MEFFNESVANTLQYYTFPLEVVGITLATIEVRFQALTERINRVLARNVEAWESAKASFKADHPILYRAFGGDWFFNIPLPRPMYRLMTLLVVCLALIGLVLATARILVGLEIVDVTLEERVSDVFMIFFYVAYLPVAGGAMILITMTLVAVKFVANRAVGTLGIIIAGLGVLGEGYQFVTQLVH